LSYTPSPRKGFEKKKILKRAHIISVLKSKKRRGWFGSSVVAFTLSMAMAQGSIPGLLKKSNKCRSV
jgi:hypothetical protein